MRIELFSNRILSDEYLIEKKFNYFGKNVCLQTTSQYLSNVGELFYYQTADLDKIWKEHLNDEIVRGNVKKVKKLLNNPNLDLNASDPQGRNSLSLAIVSDHQEIFDNVIQHGSIDISKAIPEQSDMTYLALASAYKIEYVKKLVALGFGSELSQSLKFNAMGIAAYHGHIEILRYLLTLPGADPNLRDVYGYTPLAYAITEGCVGCVKLLVEDGKLDFSHHFQELNKSYLHLAIETENKEIFIQLILDSLLNRPDLRGNTPLHYAACLEDSYFAETLLKQFNIQSNVLNHLIFTPLTFAVIANHEEVVRAFLSFPRVKTADINMNCHTLDVMAFVQGFDNLGDVLEKQLRKVSYFWKMQKLLAHQFSLEVRFKDSEKKSSLILYSASSYPFFCYDALLRSTELYQETLQYKEGLCTLVETIQKARSYLRLRNSSKASIEHLQLQFAERNTLTIPISWTVGEGGHTVFILICPRLKILIKSDRSDDLGNDGLKVYTFNPKNIDQFFESLSHLDLSGHLYDFYQTGVDQCLDLKLEIFLPQSTQSVGTCGWTSAAKPIVKAERLIHYLRNGFALDAALEKATHFYKKWQNWEKLRLLTEFSKARFFEGHLRYIQEETLKAIYDFYTNYKEPHDLLTQQFVMEVLDFFENNHPVIVKEVGEHKYDKRPAFEISLPLELLIAGAKDF